MSRTPGLDGLTFDTLPFEQDGVPTVMIDIGRCEVVQALMVAAVVVMLDEGSDLALEFAW